MTSTARPFKRLRRSRLVGLTAALALVCFPAAAQAGTLASSPPSSTYNPQPWFFGSQFNNFQVTNSGSDTTFGGASITGPDAGRFSLNGDFCNGLTLSDTQSCNVGVNFNPPQGPGNFTAQLEIPSDGSPNPLVIPLTAQALAGPVLTADPSEIDFGVTLPGTTLSRQVTITNDGDFQGGVQQAFILGPSVFGMADDQCSQQLLDPGDSCTLTALFTPSTAKAYQGSIFAIVGSEPNPVFPINLSGEGRLAPGPAPDTQITRSPQRKTRSTTASFQFTSAAANVTFECQLDNEAFAPCNSPSTYVVKRGKHSFQVRAKDAGGTADATPAAFSWKVKKAKKKQK